MVCPKLKKGTCGSSKKKCNKKYKVKMQKYKACSVFKRSKAAKRKAPKKKAAPRKKSKRRKTKRK